MKSNALKKIIVTILILIPYYTNAQMNGSITVGGDFDKFYPTVWVDGGWQNNAPSELTIGRSETHQDSSWRGTLIAAFKYHTDNWGNGAQFIDADISQVSNKMGWSLTFIAGWKDVSFSNGSRSIVIWLRGGGTTYFFRSLYANTCTIYDGVVNALPFQVINGSTLTYKAVADSNVNSNGLSKSGTAFFNGNGLNYFNGNVGIGTSDTKGYKFAVAGNMIAESIKVKSQGTWPDYVFNKDHILPTLEETEKHIKEKGHLAGIPSAEDVKSNGVNLGEMDAKLLQKIEELTLYMIEFKKKNEELSKELNEVKRQLKPKIAISQGNRKTY